MLGTTRFFSAEQFTELRQARGYTLQAVADGLGVDVRTVKHWAAGTRVPGNRAFGRLVRLLGCRADELTRREPGTETLADLRRDAGMTAREVMLALRSKRGLAELAVTDRKLVALERGKPVGGFGQPWCSPEQLGRLARALSRLYRVPERMVIDAWQRSRPEDVAPLLPAKRGPAPAQRQGRLADWQSLNERQRAYLTCLYHQDQHAEREYARRRAETGRSTPAAEWRTITVALHADPRLVGRTEVQHQLAQQGVHDQGTGASLAALERRELITLQRDRVFVSTVGEVSRTRAALTSYGRAVARAGLDNTPTLGTPTPLLSRWLWSTLARVARAHPGGAEFLTGHAKHHLGVGRSPDRIHPSRGFIELRQPTGAPGEPFLWFLTEAGQRHIGLYLATYRQRYPEVDTTGLEALGA
ncbi:helix-turn-helix domain-containing protein [Actinopolyspora erythraea]|uniref:helix-turn-helix domain-containing protein n=1 Tax=Actinopolyspora erythraea TaxID=414996 RepID=UPI0012FDF585|nr:helix-turn-helix domain-containing protein [Actinopolyspora erythraea]